MGFWKRIFGKNLIEEDETGFFNEMDVTSTDPDKMDWDWDNLVDERNYLKISDPYERGKYIRSLIEQIKEASGELDKLSYEYNLVTATLRDMDELDALPQGEKEKVAELAKQVSLLQKEDERHKEKKSRMTDVQFHHMEKLENGVTKAYDDIKEAEDYRERVREDLIKLDGEYHSYTYRIDELKRDIANSKGIIIICMVAMVLCIGMLLILQFGFEMDTKLGYLLTILTGAVCLTFFYVRFQEQQKDLHAARSGLNRIILLQNTVKIRYVNNANLLDYLYTKYKVSSAKELKNLWEIFEEERIRRELDKQNEEELDFYRAQLLKCLRCYQLNDVKMWLHEPLALMDHKEMVEIRHEHIVRRQKLRSRMDYNKRLAKDGEKEIKEFIVEFPEYKNEVLSMMDRYDT